MHIEIPLLADHHSHPLLYASLLTAIDLSNVQDLEQACQLISAASKSPGVVLAHGWKDSYFKFPPERLEQLPACAIFNVSLHDLLLNTPGERSLAKQFGSEIKKLRDRHWYERNLRVVLNWFARLNGSPGALTEFYDHLEELGVWSAEELLLVDQQEIHWFEEAGLTDRTKFWAEPETYAKLPNSDKEKVYGLKLFTDGAFGAWTAAISQPYRGSPNNRGMLIYADDELTKVIAKCAITKKAIAIHAIGDRAIEQTLMAIESLGQNSEFREIRIEHAQLISREQAERAKNRNIILSMQPNFNADTVDYADRLSNRILKENNPFRMLIDEVGFEPGLDLILGSDGMPHGAKFALQQSLFPTIPNQRLSLEEFQSGYCTKDTGKFASEINDQEISSQF